MSAIAELPYKAPPLTELPITVGEMEAELRRELRERSRVYPRLIAKGQLSQAQADRRCAVLQAALRRLGGGWRP